MSVDYTTFQDTELTLPKPNGDIDHEIDFNTPDADPGKSAVLSFQANPNGGAPTLALIVNNNTVTTVTFGNDTRRVWQENLNQSILDGADPNTLRLRVTGGGSVSVSDFHLLYKKL
jgi:hypothetical protein